MCSIGFILAFVEARAWTAWSHGMEGMYVVCIHTSRESLHEVNAISVILTLLNRNVDI
jgi:hypothetical protein